jgi:hypothetical protein
MKSFLYFTLLLLLFACGSGTMHKSQKNLIKIGVYEFNFPGNFKLIEEGGIDSYVGKVVGDSIALHFDYGYYSNPLVQTVEEYLAEGLWKMSIPVKFMKPGITYDNNNEPRVDIIGIRAAGIKDSLTFGGADLIANCRHDSILFEYPIYIPKEVKQHIVKEDSLGSYFRKTVIAKDPGIGTTGIYLRNANNVALVLYTNRLTKLQQDKVINIFSTLQIVEK